jgi:hypothetical protein
MPSLRAVPVEASAAVTGLVDIDVDNAGNKIQLQKVLLREPIRTRYASCDAVVNDGRLW